MEISCKQIIFINYEEYVCDLVNISPLIIYEEKIMFYIIIIFN